MTTISSIDARYAQDQVGRASMTVKASVSNLVTGKKTDANVADLSVGTVLATRVGTLRVTVGNAGQAKSLLETAKGALDTITDLLQKQKNLAVKAADDSLSNNERAFLNQEFQAIVSEINRIAGNTNFNGKKLLDGSISGVAGTSTTTGIGDEQYSLLKASDITSSGTVASGDLVNSHALAGENKITFSATTAGNAIMTIDSNGTGINGSQTLNFTATTSSITTASAFVTAANASTDSNFQQFSFIDNGDGSVTVRAKEAGTHLNNYTFSLDDDTTGDLNATFGNDGSPDDMEIGTGSARAFTSSQTAATAGAEGVFKTVAANNIADTKFSGAIAFGADSSGSGAATVNGVKRVVTFTLNDQQADAETFTFGGVAFAYDDTPDAVTDIMAGADATETAFNTAAVLNANTTLNVDWVFTSLAGVVTATAKNYGDQTDVAADTYVAGTANITYAVDTAGSNGVAASPTLTIKDASGNTISTTTITIIIQHHVCLSSSIISMVQSVLLLARKT
ncbi:MAG: hypothetical protein K0R98_1349 [Rickettsiaceae bacterium]|nr:hypothetical protein [Rickettsiaceae bacterium]